MLNEIMNNFMKLKKKIELKKSQKLKELQELENSQVNIPLSAGGGYYYQVNKDDTIHKKYNPNINYEQKYLKYKQKYLNRKN